MKFEGKIPEPFYRGENHPRAKTVGQLKKLLDQLPDALPVGNLCDSGTVLVVFNRSRPDIHLSFESTEDY